jgi:DNA-binding MarR family transcriptional regulator
MRRDELTWERMSEGCFEHASYLTLMMFYTRALENAILKSGITTTQYRILLRVIGHRGCMRMGELAGSLDITASCASGAVAQLVDMKAATRIELADDRRGVYVHVTEHGRSLANMATAKIYPVMKDIVDNVPNDLYAYVSGCTLQVAYKNALFEAGDTSYGRNGEARVRLALCDEILHTSNLATHITHDEGLSLVEYRVLLDLNDHILGTHPNEISHRLSVRRNSIAAAQSTLIDREFVKRVPDIRDRRSVIIELTCDGFAVLRRTAIAMSEGLHTRILPNLTPEDLITHRELARQALAIRRIA